MVEDVAGVVKAVASMVEAATDASKEVIDVDRVCTSSMVVVARLLEPMVQVTWRMVNVRSSAMAVKSRMMTI